MNTLLLVLVSIGAATLVKAIFGFGDGLVGMPLLILAVGLQVAAPLFAFVTSLITILLLWNNWQALDVRSAWHLVVSSAVGIPIGTFFLTSLPEQGLKAALGALLVVFGLYSLTRYTPDYCIDASWGVFFGFISGIFTGAFNTGGPPVVVFGKLRRWSPEEFRATLQGGFFFSNIVLLLSHALSGLWTTQVFSILGLVLPVVLVCYFVGSYINHLLPPRQFDRLLNGLLIILGISLIIH